MCCCCCPPAITALFCLWVQSGFSKGTVAGALTFFPPDPALYKFERRDANGNLIPEDVNVDEQDAKTKNDNNNDLALNDNNNELIEENANGEQQYKAKEGEAREKIKSPAQQLTDRAKDLRRRAKKRNTRDARDAKNNVKYTLLLDPRLSAPRFENGGDCSIECIKVRTPTGAHVAAVIYKVPQEIATASTKTIIYSHGNATDVGAMFPLQSILAHSLQCNVVSYDYSGYGESGGVPMEANTYSDIAAVYAYTVKNVCNDDASKVILYGQSVGSGPCCHLACRQDDIGGMVLHSPFTSGMRVLTPSRYVQYCVCEACECLGHSLVHLFVFSSLAFIFL
jgi:hypothetical protein